MKSFDYDEQEQAGPQEDDITISDSGPLGSRYSVGIVNGKFIGEYRTWEETVAAIKKRTKKDNFYPTIWRISDHGNASIVSLEE